MDGTAPALLLRLLCQLCSSQLKPSSWYVRSSWPPARQQPKHNTARAFGTRRCVVWCAVQRRAFERRRLAQLLEVFGGRLLLAAMGHNGRRCGRTAALRTAADRGAIQRATIAQPSQKARAAGFPAVRAGGTLSYQEGAWVHGGDCSAYPSAGRETTGLLMD